MIRKHFSKSMWYHLIVYVTNIVGKEVYAVMSIKSVALLQEFLLLGYLCLPEQGNVTSTVPVHCDL